MTLENEIRKEFCPNCEAETPCTHEAELYVCDICGEDFAKYIVSRNCNVSDVSMTRDVSTDIKTLPSIENTNPDYYKQEIARLTAELGEVLKAFDDAQAEVARRDEEVAELRKQKYIPVHDTLTDAGKEYYEKCIRQEKELARLNEIIARLKEDGERLASGYEQVSREAVPYCMVCKKDAFSGYLGQIKHDDWCPITLHRALMKELK